MGSPQDPRTARRKRERRAKKNAEWELKRARENAEAAAPKAPAKTATSSSLTSARTFRLAPRSAPLARASAPWVK